MNSRFRKLIKLVRSSAPLLATLTVAPCAWAAPSITSTSVNEASDGDLTIQIQGAGFGEKKQAAPVLVDRVDYAYENGIFNAHHAGLADGTILQDFRDQDVTFNPDNVWTAAKGDIQITSSKPPRHEHSDRHYYFEGANSRVGNPIAYGGQSGWDTPSDNHQIYVAWWYKPKYTPSLYWRISPLNYSGTFSKGETLDIGGIAKATYIGQDSNGQINLVFHSNPPLNDIKGKNVIGLSSDAMSTFPPEHISSGDIGYETPGSQKFIRVWEAGSGKEGIRFSWTQMHQTVSARDEVEGVVNWKTADLNPGEWNLLELEMDTDTGRIDLFLNTKHFTGFEIDPRLELEGKSPTIALMGLNGKVGKLQESEMDDIYMDSTLQRVVLADAKEFNNISHYEIQRPIKWADNNIEFVLYEGALSSYKSSFIYVFDNEGNVNKTGIPVCEECKAPPSTVNLDID